MPPRVRASTRNTRATAATAASKAAVPKPKVAAAAAPQAKIQQVKAQVKAPPAAPAKSKKRAREDADQGNDGDTLNRQRSVKKKKKKEELSDGEPAEQSLPGAKTPRSNTEGATIIPLPPQLTDTAAAAVAETPGTAKRLKFNPEVHGAELQDRFLQLKEDLFEKLVSPRKGTSSAGGIAQNLELAVRRPPKSKNNPKPKSKFTKKVPLPSTTKPAPRPAPIVSLSLGERLRRLGSPATVANTSIKPTNILPVRARPAAAPAAPAVKSTKPLTKPTFELPGDAHMKKRAVEREERRKRMEEAAAERETAKRAGRPGVGAKKEVGQNEGETKGQEQVENPRASPPTNTPQASSSTASAPTSAAVPVTTTTTTTTTTTASSAVSGLSPVKLATSLIPSFVTRGFTAVTGAVRMSVPSSPAPKQAPEPEPEPALPEITPEPEPEPEPESRHREEEEEAPEPEPEPQPQPQTPDEDLSAQEKRRREVEEEVRRLRAEAAERGKESAMMWAEQMRMKAAKPAPS